MKREAIIGLFLLALVAGLWAQDVIGNNTTNPTPVFSSVSSVDSPWTSDSKICVLVREYVLKTVFLIIFLIFLAGVATISGAAFPQWRNYGSQMIIGSIGAVILYIIGSSALRFLLGTSVCGL